MDAEKNNLIPNGDTEKNEAAAKHSLKELAKLKREVAIVNESHDEMASWKELQGLEGNAERDSVLEKLDAANSYLALINIGWLSPRERNLLRSRVVGCKNPILAYLALLDVKDLTFDESTTLRAAIQVAFQDIYEYLTPPALRDGINALLRTAGLDEYTAGDAGK